MSRNIRILQFPGTMLFGGVGSVVMNIYRNIEVDKIQFDFCVPRLVEGPFDSEIINKGGKIFYVPQIREAGILRYILEIIKIIKENGPYLAVHVHSVHVGAIILVAAKLAGVKFRIYHVHNTKDPAIDRLFFHKAIELFLKYIIRKSATHLLACGKNAGEYIYGKNSLHKNSFKVINNAIDLSRFYPYPASQREELREKLGFNKNYSIL